MCGIVGYVGQNEALPFLLDGLRRLEYRGYDSAGIAVLSPTGPIQVHKRQGKLDRLLESLEDTRLTGHLGIGHTRWATHGAPTTSNAHPHIDTAGRIVVVHNGIIENYSGLRAGLKSRGHRFLSETDTEVLPHLIEEAYADASSDGDIEPADAFVSAVRQALQGVEGAYALAAFTVDAPEVLVAARHFSPLVVGVGEGANFVASDIPALLHQTRTVMPLEDGEIAVITPGSLQVTDMSGAQITREPMEVTWDSAAAEKAGYRHFVRKEIDEQPRALADTLRGRLTGSSIHIPELDTLPVDRIRSVYCVAAGTSLYAGLVGKMLLERWSRLPVEVAVASELRYGDPVLDPETLVLCISQSGETADTLAAMRLANEAESPTLAVTNVVGSSIARGSSATLYLQVGPEIGVVATKTFTGQLAVLALLAAELGRRRGALTSAEVAAIAEELREIPEYVANVIDTEEEARKVAERIRDCHSAFFFGRRFGYPVALEGALKLKEISYIHAEGYPAGELKHGPIAMLEPAIPVVAVATQGTTYDKVISNIEEVRARSARVYAVANDGDSRIADLAEHVFRVPRVREELAPFVDVIPLQLLAYHTAVALGRDVDQPRNLAKSVTVE